MEVVKGNVMRTLTRKLEYIEKGTDVSVSWRGDPDPIGVLARGLQSPYSSHTDYQFKRLFGYEGAFRILPLWAEGRVETRSSRSLYFGEPLDENYPSSDEGELESKWQSVTIPTAMVPQVVCQLAEMLGWQIKRAGQPLVCITFAYPILHGWTWCGAPVYRRHGGEYVAPYGEFGVLKAVKPKDEYWVSLKDDED